MSPKKLTKVCDHFKNENFTPFHFTPYILQTKFIQYNPQFIQLFSPDLLQVSPSTSHNKFQFHAT